MQKEKEHYTFHSVQTHFKKANGHMEEITEAISVKNGKGQKTVRKRVNNTVRVAKRPLSITELSNIRNKKFMPTLFEDCHGDCSASAKAKAKANGKTRKTKGKRKPSNHQK